VILPPPVRDDGPTLREVPAAPVQAPRVAPLSSAATNPPPVPRHPDAMEGEYVLAFFSDRDRDAFAALAVSRGAKVLGSLPLARAIRLRVPGEAALDALRRDGPTPIEWGPNYRVRQPRPQPMAPGLVPANAGIGGRLGTWFGLPSDISSWGQGITVAVLDTGVARHAALNEGRIARLDLLPDAPATGSDAWHGAAVASLVAGSGTVKGLAPAANLLSVRVLSPEGQGDTFTLAQGIVEAVDRGARVINLSLGTSGDSFVLKRAVDYATAKGAVIVAAVGNDGHVGVDFPAAYPSVLAVAAVDASERTPAFSNRGLDVDLAAPGVGVFAAGTNDTVVFFSGTSAATPLVSGALAALLSRSPGLPAAEAASILRRYADDVGEPGDDPAAGAGIVNPVRAIGRDRRGIFDVAVSPPALRARRGVEGLTAVGSAQNRGTEVLPKVELTMTVDGVTESRVFGDVGVGQTVSHTMVLDSERFRQTGRVTVTVRAVAAGVEDLYPGNNERTTTLIAPSASVP
jgi:subtilisin family serine protease